MTRPIDAEVSRYIANTHKQPTLAREEEMRLARAWLENEDKQARDKLLGAHLRYVVSIAMKYRRYGVPVSELISEGNVGLLHALKKFEPQRGLRFVTYAAYWIRAYILNHIIRQWSLVGGGSGALRSKMFFRLRREKTRASNLFETPDEVEEHLSEKLGVSKPRLRQMLQQLEARDVSLDTPVYGDSQTKLSDTFESSDRGPEQSLGDQQIGEHLTRHVRNALSHLDERERYIVERRLMADPEDELSLAEIGRQLGVSRERARQLEARAKGKLKSRMQEVISALQKGSEALSLKTEDPCCCGA